ncbi:lytic transglycosylase domain-containing protein [Nocardioides sp. YIM 152315]|uniref:aggregation-promoting factor C-terminal-like domain-containing protein n=1 Tax=Nocardioides sp. YIM 152315 TaxID=3031760 RepID=UPI0023DB88F8|nr:lytic transglycosylase domain-containing protein [Nocardioides sp. YIM 152315]MDF1603292.1 lytic transglycosylase domain-containing protein [Nocardioides sp. YIM 152315]
MSKRAKYVPKHRNVPEPTLRDAPRRALRTGLVMTSVAAAVTGVSVAGGVLGSSAPVPTVAQDLGGSITGGASDGDGAAAAAADVDRDVVSRSADRDRRPDPAKVSALSVDSGPARTASVDVTDGDPHDIARALLPQFGFSSDQFGCLDSLWTRESNWNPAAHNPSSGAHGIPQALPGSKMATAGPDWESNPVTQIRWGLGYIQDRYGSPCGAWGHSESHGWY